MRSDRELLFHRLQLWGIMTWTKSLILSLVSHRLSADGKVLATSSTTSSKSAEVFQVVFFLWILWQVSASSPFLCPLHFFTSLKFRSSVCLRRLLLPPSPPWGGCSFFFCLLSSLYKELLVSLLPPSTFHKSSRCCLIHNVWKGFWYNWREVGEFFFHSSEDVEVIFVFFVCVLCVKVMFT